MKSREFITETQVKPYSFATYGIDQKSQLLKTMKLLNTHYRESLLLMNNPIWRGIKEYYSNIVEFDTTRSERQSSNTSNHYTLLIDNSPYFVGWPKRSKSLICSTDPHYANSYGTLYAIFPADGTNIAVCPKQDIWETNISLPEFGVKWKNKVCNLADFNDWLRFELGLPDVRTNFNDIIKATKTTMFQRRLGMNWPDVEPQEVIPILQKALSPKKAGFKLMTIPQFAKNAPKDKEVWVQGKMVAIKHDVFYKFKDAYNKVK